MLIKVAFYADGETASDFYGVYIDAVPPGGENVPHFTDPIAVPPGSDVIVSVIVLCEEYVFYRSACATDSRRYVEETSLPRCFMEMFVKKQTTH